jgi:hypothetical protein
MPDAQPYVLGPGEGRVIDLGDFGMIVKASGQVGYFDDLAAALRRDDVSAEHLERIAGAHAMEVVGPPSQRYV